MYLNARVKSLVEVVWFSLFKGRKNCKALNSVFTKSKKNLDEIGCITVKFSVRS